jgi:transposase-like protein
LPANLSPYRDARSAEYFLRKLLGDGPTTAPRVINVDGNAAYPAAFKALQEAGELAPECELRPVKYLNNIAEQDHRFMCCAPLARSSAE